MLLDECKNIDVIITTALVPGRKAPVLIKKAHIEAMPSGGVTIDLAAASGGNVETTVPGTHTTQTDRRTASILIAEPYIYEEAIVYHLAYRFSTLLMLYDLNKQSISLTHEPIDFLIYSQARL
jgi:hypothetical protein